MADEGSNGGVVFEIPEPERLVPTGSDSVPSLVRERNILDEVVVA